jgi:hypothetical protein
MIRQTRQPDSLGTQSPISHGLHAECGGNMANTAVLAQHTSNRSLLVLCIQYPPRGSVLVRGGVAVRNDPVEK